MMSRLAELRQRATEHAPEKKEKSASESQKEEEGYSERDEESQMEEIDEGHSERDSDSGDDGGYNPSAYLDEYMDDAKEVQACINAIIDNSKKIQSLYDSLVRATNIDEEKDINESLQEMLDENDTTAQTVRDILQDLRFETDKFAQENPRDVGVIDTRNNMHAALARRFIGAMSTYQEVQSRGKARLRERMAQQLRIVDPSISDAMIEDVVNSGTSPQVFADQLKEEKINENAQNALIFLEEQQEDMKKLEESIRLLNKMFLDMQTFVESQGEMLDQIEFSVDQARSYTLQALQDLSAAKKGANRARVKWVIIVVLVICFGIIFCFVICVIVVVVIIALVLVSGVLPAGMGAISGIIAGIVEAVKK